MHFFYRMFCLLKLKLIHLQSFLRGLLFYEQERSYKKMMPM